MPNSDANAKGHGSHKLHHFLSPNIVCMQSTWHGIPVISMVFDSGQSGSLSPLGHLIMSRDSSELPWWLR